MEICTKFFYAQGQVKVIVGKENLEFQGGPFSFYGTLALTHPTAGFKRPASHLCKWISSLGLFVYLDGYRLESRHFCRGTVWFLPWKLRITPKPGNEWRDLRLSNWTTQLRRIISAVASRWHRCVRYYRPGN